MVHSLKLKSAFAVLIAAFALVGCQSPMFPLDPTATKWELDVQKFESADRENRPAKGGLLLAGSSSFRMWTSAAENFPEKHVINRGFGGSQMSDLLYYVDRIVVAYEPAEILVYEGDNDLAAGESAETIFSEFQEFTRVVRKSLPKSTVYFVSIKPSPKRANLIGKMETTNQLIADYCNGKSHVEFIDVFTPMLNSVGRPRAELFGPDDLHMNATGYALWTKIVREKLGLPYLAGTGG